MYQCERIFLRSLALFISPSGPSGRTYYRCDCKGSGHGNCYRDSCIYNNGFGTLTQGCLKGSNGSLYLTYRLISGQRRSITIIVLYYVRGQKIGRRVKTSCRGVNRTKSVDFLVRHLVSYGDRKIVNTLAYYNFSVPDLILGVRVLRRYALDEKGSYLINMMTINNIVTRNSNSYIKDRGKRYNIYGVILVVLNKGRLRNVI